MKATRAWMLVFALGAAACDPDNPCDPGYSADHGICIPSVDSWTPDAGSGDDDDAGPGAGSANGDTYFGKPCEVMQDCGGKAPMCGAPMLPLCTAINCLEGESECPGDWTCLDISSWERPYPEVKSICVKI